MSVKLFHDPGFAAPIGNHVMPMQKFEMVADRLRKWPEIEILRPRPLPASDLLRVHTSEYVMAVKTGTPRELAESQKFPWSPGLFSSVLLTNGGVLAAARTALAERVSGALASGFHHAFADHGEGFCTFNGLVIALDTLWAEGRIHSAAILDLDLHYGNGTASLVASRPWIKALSIYGNDYADNVPHGDVTVRRHSDGDNHFSCRYFRPKMAVLHSKGFLRSICPGSSQNRIRIFFSSRPALTLCAMTLTPRSTLTTETSSFGTRGFLNSLSPMEYRWPGFSRGAMRPT